MTGEQLQQLQAALLSAFPSKDDLSGMVRVQLNENLEAIAGGTNLGHIVFSLITWAEARGRAPELATKASGANPSNLQLREVALALARQAPQTSVAPSSLRASQTSVAPSSPRNEAQAALPDSLADLADNREHLRLLVEQLQSHGKNLLPFVGAGLSKPFGFALWSDFLLDQGRRAGIEPSIREQLNGGEYEEAAQDLLDTRGSRRFHDAIGSEYGSHKIEGQVLTGAVTYLPHIAAGPVITTNFDRVLEQVFEQAGRPFQEKVWGAHADLATEALNRNERMLLKLHGDVRDRADRVLTKSDYERNYGSADGSVIDSAKPLPKLLRQMMIGRPLLFVGCSLKDDRTMRVLENVALDYEAIAHYAIVEKPATEEAFHERDRFLAEYGIRPLWYPHGEHHLIEAILAYLSAKANP